MFTGVFFGFFSIARSGVRTSFAKGARSVGEWNRVCVDVSRSLQDMLGES